MNTNQFHVGTQRKMSDKTAVVLARLLPLRKGQITREIKLIHSLLAKFKQEKQTNSGLSIASCISNLQNTADDLHDKFDKYLETLLSTCKEDELDEMNTKIASQDAAVEEYGQKVRDIEDAEKTTISEALKETQNDNSPPPVIPQTAPIIQTVNSPQDLHQGKPRFIVSRI